MQSLQTMAKAPTQPANLPPLQNLPSWSRNTLGRRKQPRPIIRDRLQPIKSIREEMDEVADEKSNENSNFSGRIVSAPSRGHLLDQSHRIDNVEKRIDYLRTQHAETLSNLHSEIERLKAENKELNFKLVMARTGVDLPKETSPSPEESKLLQSASPDEIVKDDASDGHQNVEETKKEETEPTQWPGKESLSTAQASSSSEKRNTRYGSGKTGTTSKSTPTPPLSAKGPQITKPKSSGKKHKIKSHNKQEKPTNLSSPYAFSLSATPPAPTATNQGIPLGQSLLVVTIKDKTVKVHMPSDSAPRSPTLVECKAIIKHQSETNKRQEQELSKLKSDLNDALYSDKWTPDAYLLAKSYVTDDVPTNTRHNTPASRSLPRLNSREQAHSGRLAAGRMHVVHDSVSLPVLRPNGGANVADRKRRQQALVRGRGKKDFY